MKTCTCKTSKPAPKVSRALDAALSRLAGNVEDLAGTVAEMNASLRARLLLDQQPEPAPAIEHEPAAEGNGTGRRKRQSA
jgi:hypothetical protein